MPVKNDAKDPELELEAERERAQQLVREGKAVDLNNMPRQSHHWVDRGLVMSCEGGDHPPHRAFKRR